MGFDGSYILLLFFKFIELDREEQQWNVFNRISEFEKFIIITEENLNFPIWAFEILSKSTLP